MNKYDIKNLINKTKDITIFEAGAGQGEDTIEFLTVFSDTENLSIFCMEPDSRNIPAFRATINDSRVHFFEGVVGDVDGEVEFNTSTKSFITGQELIFSSSLRKPGKDIYKMWPSLFQNEGNFSPTKVKSYRFDTFVKENNIDHIDWIHLDIQGAEDLFINGGLETLNTKVKYFYTEYNNEEVYKGNPNLDKIVSMLPNFSIMQDFITDVLLVNNSI
jgi:FkbM family methyltransferase